MIDDAIAGGDVRADDDTDLVLCGAAVQAGGDKDSDAFGWNAGGVQTGKNRRQSDRIGCGASDIADVDGGGALAACQFRERSGSNGVVERLGERGFGVRYGWRGAGFKERIVRPARKGEVEAVFAEGEVSLHRGNSRRVCGEICVDARRDRFPSYSSH